MIVKVDGSRCIGCSICVDVCPNEALAMDNGSSVLKSEELCEGCGACVGFCEQHALDLVESVPAVAPAGLDARK